MVQTGSELRAKMVKLKTRRLVVSEDNTKTHRIYNPNRDLSKIDNKGTINCNLITLFKFCCKYSLLTFVLRNTPVLQASLMQSWKNLKSF